MARPWMLGAIVFLVATSGVASAKILACPPGRFEIRDGGGSNGLALGAAVLRLADGGMVELEGVCQAAPAEGRLLGLWRGRFRVRWPACEGSTGAVRLRARLEDDCLTVRGLVRTPIGGRKAFKATRVAVCGDLLVSPGEDCDDGNAATGDCCVACRAEPGCYVPCERTADCAPQAVCERYDDTCRATTGTCRPRYQGECPAGGDFSVCGCDGNPYPTECDAWAAGVPVQGGDGLNSPVGRRCRCQPDGGRGCRAGRFCETPYRCIGAVRRELGGICTDPPVGCDGELASPVCGCDGTTYRNDCERKLARVQKACVCLDTVPAVPGAHCVSVALHGCDCSGAL
jgi:cysteine-rich repeat protein